MFMCLILTMEFIESQKPNISQIDGNDELKMFCYKTCDNSKSKEFKECRGVVYDNENNLVFKGLGYTDEYVLGNDYNFEEATFFPSMEGCLIRMFYHNNKWYTTTHHKLDAHVSKWSSNSSYGELFRNAFHDYDTFIDSLDTSRSYLFLLENTSENRLVCDGKECPEVYHVGTMVGEPQNPCLDIEDDIGVKKPTALTIRSKVDIEHYVENVDYRQYQGVIGFREDGTQFKLYNPRYYEYLQTRGNESSIKFRYLQLRMNHDMCKNLYDLYPEQGDVMDNYENIIRMCIQYVYQSYVNRFIHKQFVKVPKDEYKLMITLHKWHIEDRQHNRISLNKVAEVVNDQSPVFLNRIVKRIIKYGDYSKMDIERHIPKKPYRNEASTEPVVEQRAEVVSESQ